MNTLTFDVSKDLLEKISLDRNREILEWSFEKDGSNDLNLARSNPDFIKPAYYQRLYDLLRRQNVKILYIGSKGLGKSETGEYLWHDLNKNSAPNEYHLLFNGYQYFYPDKLLNDLHDIWKSQLKKERENSTRWGSDRWNELGYLRRTIF